MEKFNCQSTEDFVYIMAYLAECKVYKRDVYEEERDSQDGGPIQISDKYMELIQL